jgi:hypothetical protein
MTKLAQVIVDQVYPDNGFFNLVNSASIDQIQVLTEGEQLEKVIVVIEEEFDEITESNSTTIAVTANLAVHGHINTANEPSPKLAAARLRQDLTRLLKSVSKETLTDDAGKVLCRGIALTGRREILPSDIAEGYTEVIVRVAIDYRDSSPPVPGI